MEREGTVQGVICDLALLKTPLPSRLSCYLLLEKSMVGPGIGCFYRIPNYALSGAPKMNWFRVRVEFLHGSIDVTFHGI